MSDYNIYDIAVSFLSGIKDYNAKNLIAKFETSEKIFEAKKSDFEKTHGIGEYRAVKIVNSKSEALERAEKEIKYLTTNDVSAVTFFDEQYPKRLKECDDAPIVLYYKGEPDFNSKKIISIVGTRSATKYGIDFTKNLISELATRYPELVIVSGLAYGIDICAHQSALESGLKTWAVLGHSLEIIYPAKHRNVAEKISKEGSALVCDYPHGSYIDTTNFIKRNRIVAGICDALLIVESAEKGGAMVTANIANHYNKDVFALPGNIDSKYSKGCNNLIKSHRAHLIQSIEDIEYILNWSGEKNIEEKKKEKNIPENISENEKKVAEILKKYDFLDIDNISRQSGLSSNTLSITLLELEFKGLVKAMPGKIFSLK